jgi:prepilin-type N-terminal cleavage/methylation domain-containing protein
MKTRSSTSQGAPLARRAGFSLVEMMVVIILICILAGLVFYLMKIVGFYQARAETHRRLGKIRAAIEEFYAEYGKYPPVPDYGTGTQPFGYEYPITNLISQPVVAPLVFTAHRDDGVVFRFGLMSFLLLRHSGHTDGFDHLSGGSALFTHPQWTHENQSTTGQDQDRDANAVARWRPYIEEFDHAVYSPREWPGYAPGVAAYTNSLITVLDGWGHELHYQSTPPYQSYRLWSDGPSSDTTGDDIATGPGR